MNKRKLNEFEIIKRQDEAQYISNLIDGLYAGQIEYSTAKEIENVLLGEAGNENEEESSIDEKIETIFNLIKRDIVKKIRSHKLALYDYYKLV